MDSFVSILRMKNLIKRVKKTNDISSLLGLDIGRMFVGTSISDKLITKTKILKTFPLQTGFNTKFYPPQSEFVHNKEFYENLNKIIKNHKVKGLIIGYPILDNKPSQHALFIESFVKYMYKNEILKIPCTFVNEAYSTFEAAHFLEMLQVDQKNYNPQFSNNKLLKDQAAACIILQRFIDFYNLEEEDINNKIDTESLRKEDEKFHENIFTKERININQYKKMPDENEIKKANTEKDIFYKLIEKIGSKKV